MRIAVINGTSRRVGGVETYLETILPGLQQAGMDVGFWHESGEPLNRPAISIPAGVQTWNVAKLGSERALADLRAWQPDLLFTHHLADPELEASTLDVASAVFFVHNYYGTCVGGHKTFRVPVTRPCSRHFGPACLLLYYPRRCGGLNPITMARLYREQKRRLALLPRYRALLTNSEHMREEYLRHGLLPERVHTLTYLTDRESRRSIADLGAAAVPEEIATQPCRAAARPHLLFVGRMEHLKGGQILLDALPAIAAGLGTPARLTIAGDGRMRTAWQRRAARLAVKHPQVQVDFPGWLVKPRIDELYEQVTLLVVPSLWPEPFGLIGVEAGRFGVPAAAFDVGGVSEWLKDGVNGHLAAGDPPTTQGLADAVVHCLRDGAHYARLRQGAREIAERFNLTRHLHELIAVLNSAVSGGVAGSC
jgi:glycosyltransferase involved in cell wall biosynthesis